VTDVQALAAATLLVPTAAALAVLLVPTERLARLTALGAAAAVAATGLALGVLALVRADDPVRGDVLCLDAAGGILVAVDALVGAAAIAASPRYLHALRSPSARGRWRLYYAALLAFWGALLAVPLVGSLGVAWLLIEATTAASALLVAFAGRPRALEAAWKYLVLTTLGLGVALFGIVVLEAGAHGAADVGWLGWRDLAAAAPAMDGEVALLAYVLIVAGLATKIGWAPVHNWLPDAHSEAPAPVSALLSAALLPTVLLIAWRTGQVLEPAIGSEAPQRLLLGFGLVSLAVAVPFLWRSPAWRCT
jgi:hydrogenase-4 component F